MSELIKISELTLGTPDETDVIPFVDVSANATKKALRSTLKGDTGEKGDDGTSFQIKGQFDNVGQLPTTGNETGDGYFVGETKILYYWDINDTWVNYGSLQGVIGPQGIQGIQGDPGLDGEDGEDGDSAYVYIAYASDSDGTDFTTTFNANLDYIAILSTDTEIASPQASDFAGLWKNYKGVAGTNGANGTSLLSKGAYNSETTYSPYDFVLYNGSSYVCILESLDNLPTNTTYWQLMAQIGASITSGEFVEDDLVFTKDDTTTVTIENAKIDLKGEQGEQGEDGAAGANGTSFIWEDAYVAETTYAPNDVVSYNGSSYICILESTGKLPTNTTYWSLMAQKGTDGEGAGDVVAPASNTDSYIPQWDGANSKTLKDGLAVPAGGLAGLTALGEKQATLVSGTNIKTINSTSLLGSEDIVTPDEKVKYDAGDTTAGYVADKIIAGTGISVAEGTTGNENKLVINSTITQATRDSLGLDTDDTVTFANLSGINTGDQEASDFDIEDLTDSTNLRTTWSGKQDALTFGIANTNAVKIDSADVADDEYARFTANGLESRSAGEVRGDIGLDTDDSPQFAGIELGHASDTTLSRSAAGVLAVEGVVIPSISSTNALTNKRITPRVTSEESSATPTINTDNCDIHRITALTTNITSMTTNLSGTPTHGQKLIIEITGTAARAITWGDSFEASTVALPTTTVTTAMLSVGFVWNSATSKFRCLAVA